MEAKELQIGNLLEFEDGEIKTVHGIHPHGKHIHEKWCNTELNEDQEVTIALFGEKLYFDVTE